MLHQNHERLKKRGKESTYIGQKMVMKIVGIDPTQLSQRSLYV